MPRFPADHLIERARKEGYRPVAVACLIFNNRVLFVYDEEHELWQLPQGGIKPGESVRDTLERELSEELYPDLIKNIQSFSYIGTNKVTFPKATQGSRPIATSKGGQTYMRGKRYYFTAVFMKSQKIDIARTEFSRYHWATASQTNEILATIYQHGKRRVTAYAMNKLKARSIIR